VEDKGMHLQRLWRSGLVAAVLGALVGVTAVAAAAKYAQEKGITPRDCP
jgi:anti-sigma-K factor RskA